MNRQAIAWSAAPIFAVLSCAHSAQPPPEEPTGTAGSQPVTTTQARPATTRSPDLAPVANGPLKAQTLPPNAKGDAARASTHGPSCDGNPGASTDCQGRSCCTRLPVPAGSFLYLNTETSAPARTKVASFYLDEFETTVGRFKAWEAAGSPLPASGTVMQKDVSGHDVVWQSNFDHLAQRGRTLAGWRQYDTWTADKRTSAKNNVNWYTGMAFCHWDGGRLPTNVEWQYAGRGGEEHRTHPWGDEAPSRDHALYNCNGDGDPSCTLDDFLPVGSRPKGAGRWGHRDLAGSLFEWTVDHQGINRTTARSNGGGFCYIGGVDRRAPLGLKATTHRSEKPETISHMVGLRCAYDR